MPRAHVFPDGNRITLLRGEADLTQWQLASESGYGLRTIGKIEDGQPTGASTLTAVATVLSRRLKRPLGLGDLIRRPEIDAHACRNCGGHQVCIVQQGMKLLDLTGCRPAHNGQAAENRAILDDHYRFRRLASDVRVLPFYYATEGTSIAGRSLTHPDGSEWLALAGAGQGGHEKPHLKHAYRLRVKLEASGAEEADVHNRLEYVDAFMHEEREWFHTHVVWPTEALTLGVFYPEARRCRAVRGLFQMHPAEALTPTDEQPVLLADGRAALWNVTSPQQGGTYQLEWHW